MHEVSLVSELIRLAVEERDRSAEGKRILRLTVGVGELSCANPEALRFAFETLSPGTVVEGAQLEIEKTPIIGRCQDCGEAAELDDTFGPCPKCGGKEVRLEGQFDVRLKSIEVED